MKKIYAFSLLCSILAGCLTAQNIAIPLKKYDGNLSLKSSPVPNIESSVNDEKSRLYLDWYFTIPDDPEASLFYALTYVSNPDIADISLSGDTLIIEPLSPGQTNVCITASYNELYSVDTFVVGVRPVIENRYGTATFDDLALENNTFWNGSDESGGFVSGPVYFVNYYNPDWFVWYGWSYSNTMDNTNPGFMNQYSAFSAVRLDSADGKNYAVSYVDPSSELVLTDSSDHEIKGFFITNSTYAALSMKLGDDFTKKFGGEDGNEQDWFKLQITGNSLSGDSASVEFYLADFRADDNTQDYIVETWQWVDLTALGDVYKLKFKLSSSDNGSWGMNTPAFFCMDKLVIGNKTVRRDITNKSFNVYPNPSYGVIRIQTENKQQMHIRVFNTQGGEVFFKHDYIPGNELNLEHLSPGIYLLQAETAGGTFIKRIILLLDL